MVAGGRHFANAGASIGWGGFCLVLLILLCPNTAEALDIAFYITGKPKHTDSLPRPSDAGLFSGTQSQEIQAYCDGLNMSDYSCRRISRIFFARRVDTRAPSMATWDNNQTGKLGSSDSEPPYHDRWGDTRMVASPRMRGRSYYCMSLFFDPPIPPGSGMEFRWTAGSRPTHRTNERATAVSVHFGTVVAPTNAERDIRRSQDASRFRENIEGGTAFLAWSRFQILNFGRNIPEVRWCVHTAFITDTVYNRARLDGFLFGTDEEEFCRPELNAGNGTCISGHNDFIDRYCTALDLSSSDCQNVSRLVFTRSGVGEHVWDPTHGEASAEGGSSSVLSPPVKLGEYSCMSLYLDQPNPQGADIRFAWDLSRRAVVSGESGEMNALMRFYFFASGAGADHDPLNSDRSSNAFYFLRPSSDSGFEGWTGGAVSDPATEAEELKWCYYGGHVSVGEQDRGRLDNLGFAEVAASESIDSRPEIAPYCTALNIENALCTRVSSIAFLGLDAEQLAWAPDHAMGAVPGDMRSVASQQVGSEDYSCLILYFSEEPIARGSDISFQWAAGRGAGSGSSSLLVWYTPLGVDEPPTVDPGQPSISQSQTGFSAWMKHSAVADVGAVPEIRWCYFGVVSSAGEMDIGRVDRLEVAEGIGVSFVLPDPNPGPAIVEGTSASISVRSGIAFADGDSVLIRLLVEEGQHFIDTDAPNVTEDPAMPERLILEYTLSGDGAALEHVLILPTQDDNRPLTVTNIRLSLLPPSSGVEYRVSAPSSGYLIAVKDNGRLIPEYCTALNMQTELCDRVSSIVFEDSASLGRAWDANHAMGAVPGDMRSVASQQAGLDDYSCMSMHFSDPLVAGSDISFQWAVGRGAGGGGSSSSMLVWFAPTGAEQLPMITLGRPRIGQEQDGFSAWIEHSAVAINRPVPEIRWCYFGGNPSPDEMDIGRVDRLTVIEGGRIRFVLSNRRPAVVEGTAAAIVVRSEVAVEAGRTVSIRLLVEEGGRFIDPNGPNVVSEGSSQLVLELPLTGDGTALEHALMLPTQDDNRPGPVANIRLALAEPLPTAGYRLGTPSSGYLIAVKDNRRLIMEYCSALNMSAALCDRVSGIVFAENESGERSWISDHPEGAVPGDDRSVASPSVGDGDYSCMSMYFDEPIVGGSDISFQWSLGRGAGGGSSSMLVWFAPTGADQPPMLTLGPPRISQEQDGFSAWMEHSAVAIDRPIPELRWCYFGANPSPGETDIGRVDRLAVSEGIAISFVLPEPNPGPAIVEGTAASILVVSPIPFADGESVLIRLLVEEGERFIDRGGPNVVAEELLSGQLVLELPLTGDGTALEHALMLPTQDDNRPEPGGNIRLALAEPPPEAGYRVSTPSSGYLITAKDNRLQIMDYCEALNLGEDLCARLSSVVFANDSTWNASHQMGALPGDMLSVASPSVGAGDYSCMSLHFSDPLAFGSDISFQWSLGRGAGGGDSSSTLLVWLAPTVADQPPMLALGQPRISQEQEGFSAWMEHSAVAIDRPVPEIRWCYFGGNPSPGEMDIGRIDRLEVSEGIAINFVLPELNPGPAIVEGATATVLLASETPFADGEVVMLRLLVEEGQRFLDPNGPNVVSEGSSQLVLELPFTGDGETKLLGLMLPTHDDDRIDPDGNIRLALAEPSSNAYRLGTPSGGFLIAVEDNDYRPNVEGLIRWWQLLRQCKAPNGCPTPSGSVPELPDSPNLPMRTEDELGNIAATFQALLADETLDVNGDGFYDTMDLRIILRYLAGLRGGALVESDDADEAMRRRTKLQAFER